MKLRPIRHCSALIFYGTLLIAHFQLLTVAHAWQIRTTEHFQFYYEASDAPLVQTLQIVAEKGLNRVCAALDYDLADRTKVYVIASPALFDSMLAGRVPDWGVGFAFPRQNLIILKSPRLVEHLLPIERTMVHEYAHIILGQKTAPYPLPRWFDEGLAMYLSGELLPRDAFLLTKAVIFHQTISLAELEYSFPANAQQAQQAYAQSHAVILHLVRQVHETGLQHLIRNFTRSHDFDDALFQTTGMERYLFYRRWEQRLAHDFGWLSLLNYADFWWFLMTLVFVLAAVMRQIKIRRRLAEMEAQEKLEDEGQHQESDPADDTLPT